ncbi:MAG: DNA repair protein RecO [Deltaproteobacteria bacterium HGW-Deltaproteobacteria-22]|jgi:DNA repair protein RecO|nr:MAG: DNA repair protein RecO [Deltaproteobacteria bacterium HGW-Deltaproteobacteria-22]
MTANDLAVTAFVVRRVTTGESDLVLSLLTRERGKIDVYARAGRRSRRRFQAGLSPCLLFQGMIAPSRRGSSRPGSLWSLEEMIVARPAALLTSRPSRMVVGQYATELVREFCPPEVPEPELFQHLDDFLVRLDQPRSPTWRDWFALEWSVLTAAGVAPELRACVLCRRPAPGRRPGSGGPSDGSGGPSGASGEPSGGSGGRSAAGPSWGFSEAAGGLVCPSCGRSPAMPVWNPAWNDILDGTGSGPDPEDAPALLALLEPWIFQVLNRKLHARGLCRSIFSSPTEW